MSVLNETRAMDLGLNSVKENDELGLLRSIDFLTEQGTKYINERLEPNAKKAVISIRDIGNAAVLQKMEIGVFLSLFSLGKMAEAAREQKLSDIGLSILYSLHTIGKAAVEQRMEGAVRVAVAYLGEIVNCSYFHSLERESLAAALAIGSIGKETFKQQNIRVPDNGGLFSPISKMVMSLPQGNEATVFSKEFSGLQSLLAQHGEDSEILQQILALSENDLTYADFNNLDDIMIKGSNSLGTIILESKNKFLLSHMLMTKLALETLNGSEYIHEAESLD
ncbi:MAG: hypothetical protein ACPK85_05920 [Methanosarcina sp.]